jgi:hypothetical protein
LARANKEVNLAGGCHGQMPTAADAALPNSPSVADTNAANESCAPEALRKPSQIRTPKQQRGSSCAPEALRAFSHICGWTPEQQRLYCAEAMCRGLFPDWFP